MDTVVWDPTTRRTARTEVGSRPLQAIIQDIIVPTHAMDPCSVGTVVMAPCTAEPVDTEQV